MSNRGKLSMEGRNELIKKFRDVAPSVMSDEALLELIMKHKGKEAEVNSALQDFWQSVPDTVAVQQNDWETKSSKKKTDKKDKEKDSSPRHSEPRPARSSTSSKRNDSRPAKPAPSASSAPRVKPEAKNTAKNVEAVAAPAASTTDTTTKSAARGWAAAVIGGGIPAAPAASTPSAAPASSNEPADDGWVKVETPGPEADAEIAAVAAAVDSAAAAADVQQQDEPAEESTPAAGLWEAPAAEPVVKPKKPESDRVIVTPQLTNAWGSSLTFAEKLRETQSSTNAPAAANSVEAGAESTPMGSSAAPGGRSGRSGRSGAGTGRQGRGKGSGSRGGKRDGAPTESKPELEASIGAVTLSESADLTPTADDSAPAVSPPTAAQPPTAAPGLGLGGEGSSAFQFGTFGASSYGSATASEPAPVSTSSPWNLTASAPAEPSASSSLSMVGSVGEDSVTSSMVNELREPSQSWTQDKGAVGTESNTTAPKEHKNQHQQHRQQHQQQRQGYYNNYQMPNMPPGMGLGGLSGRGGDAMYGGGYGYGQYAMPYSAQMMPANTVPASGNQQGGAAGSNNAGVSQGPNPSTGAQQGTGVVSAPGYPVQGQMYNYYGGNPYYTPQSFYYQQQAGGAGYYNQGRGNYGHNQQRGGYDQFGALNSAPHQEGLSAGNQGQFAGGAGSRAPGKQAAPGPAGGPPGMQQQSYGGQNQQQWSGGQLSGNSAQGNNSGVSYAAGSSAHYGQYRP